jgi:hypothetical protein
MARAQAPNPSEVFVERINFAGSGCPAGSVAGSISSDAQVFTLLFDSFEASVGPGVPFTEGRKNCQLDVKLHYPQGFSYTLTTVDYRGFGELDAGVTGLQKSTYFFQGDLQQATAATAFNGVMDRDYVLRDVIPMTAVVWSPCGAPRNLQINAEVRVNNGGHPQAQGLLTIDSINGKVAQLYGLQWRRCR